MKNFFKKYGTKTLVSLATIGSVALLVYFKAFLLTSITVPLYIFLIIAVFPLFFIWFIRSLTTWFNLKYGIGTAVNIIADDRKFIVVRYHFWKPRYAICKIERGVDVISINVKYITPYKEIEKDILNPYNSNINKSVPITTIKKL